MEPAPVPTPPGPLERRLLVAGVAIALVLGISGTAWAGCSGHSEQTRTTAQAPVEKPAPSAPQS